MSLFKGVEGVKETAERSCILEGAVGLSWQIEGSFCTNHIVAL